MEVHLTAEQEARLAQIARQEGKPGPSELLSDTAIRLIEDDAAFRAAVLEGKACADRGDFIEEEEMDARFEKMLNS